MIAYAHHSLHSPSFQSTTFYSRTPAAHLYVPCVCASQFALVGVAYVHALRAPALDYCVFSTYRDNCRRRFVNESNLHVLCTCIVSACMCLLHRVRYKHRLFRLVLVHLYRVPTAYFHGSNSHRLYVCTSLFNRNHGNTHAPNLLLVLLATCETMQQSGRDSCFRPVMSGQRC